MKYPYVIIDSDSETIQTIKLTLEDHKEYLCTGIANNREDGINLILKLAPKLVFLEVDISKASDACSGYSIIDELKKYLNILPEFIVVTKSNAHAIEGIRNGVLDYLLKPVNPNVLRRSLLRYQKSFTDPSDNTICFKSYGDYRFVNLDEVLYLKADNNTTDFVLHSGQTVEAFKTLKHFQNVLPEDFVRIHNSYIVNSKYISRIHFGKSKCTIKNLTAPIPFSRSYKNNVEEIKDLLSKKSILQL